MPRSDLTLSLEQQSCEVRDHADVLLHGVECSPESVVAHRVFSGPVTLRGEKLVRLAALNIVCGSRPEAWAILRPLSLRQWRRLLRWLDYSGLALYFFDQVCAAQQLGILPRPIAAGLERRSCENTQRTAAMAAESVEIQIQFQRSGVRYAVLKGLSLWPNSVSRPELRSQFDLDFLVSPSNIAQAREILERHGYRFYGNTGRSWEFKRNERPGLALRDLYRDTGSFRVELHAEAVAARTSVLDRSEWRELCGFAMPVLAPVDLFLGQGRHAFSHIWGEFVRAAFLVEFRRHVLFRRDDEAFWRALERQVSENALAAAALGATAHLIALVTGGFAPQEFTRWTVNRIPPPVRLWLDLYGRRAVLGSHPGNKLHLLVERELGDFRLRPSRTPREWLIPLRPPGPVIRAFPNERLSVRVARYWMQFKCILERMQFHFVEGLRFAWESRRWRRLVDQVAR